MGIGSGRIKLYVYSINYFNMKKSGLLLLAVIAAVFTNFSIAQKTPVKVITLKMPGEDGSNAGAVVWHPTLKRYYTSMIGNAIYPLAMFDAKGKQIGEETEAGHDLRGMWYNPATKNIEFNCYDQGGIGHLVLEKDGTVSEALIDLGGMNQPTAQALGVYYKNGNRILYLNENYAAVLYDSKSGEMTRTIVTISFGCKTKDEADAQTEDDILDEAELRNVTTVQYTGITKQELAILNVEDHKIELYDQKTGLITREIKLPEELSLQLNFNFCYNNGIWWFFNKEAREWVGYK